MIEYQFDLNQNAQKNSIKMMIKNLVGNPQ